MAFWVCLALFLGAALALAAPRVARILPPRTGVWVLTTASVGSALGIMCSLVMIALTGVARIPAVASETNMSAERWRLVDPIAVWLALMASVAVVFFAATFVRAVVRESALRKLARRVARNLPGDQTLVLVDDDEPHAYAISGRPSRIVVSSGLLRSLSPRERRTVLAHETAHVRHRHDVHLCVQRLAAAANPALRGCVSAGRLAVERWADEETAAFVGDRALVARALVRAALAGAARGRGPVVSLAHADGDVSRRVAALMAAPPRPRWSVAVAMSALLLATVAAPIYAADSFDELLRSASISATSR